MPPRMHDSVVRKKDELQFEVIAVGALGVDLHGYKGLSYRVESDSGEQDSTDDLDLFDPNGRFRKA